MSDSKDLSWAINRPVSWVNKPSSSRLLQQRAGKYFTWHDLIKSGTARRLGLDNTPTPEAAENLHLLVAHVLDPLVELLRRPVNVTSGYRSPAVNANLSTGPGAAEAPLVLRPGAKDSEHLVGQAADIFVTGLSAEQLAAAIANSGLSFNRLIWYDVELGGQVHVSFNAEGNQRDMRHSAVGRGYLPWSPQVT